MSWLSVDSKSLTVLMQGDEIQTYKQMHKYAARSIVSHGSFSKGLGQWALHAGYQSSKVQFNKQLLRTYYVLDSLLGTGSSINQ